VVEVTGGGEGARAGDGEGDGDGDTAGDGEASAGAATAFPPAPAAPPVRRGSWIVPVCAATPVAISAVAIEPRTRLGSLPIPLQRARA